jgi:Ser/Thr protein kinase RdoA (MazF antagonist)
VPVTARPSDQALLDLLRERGGVEVVGLSRRPYRYATSAPLEEVLVRVADGPDQVLILKDLSRDRLLGDARTVKPAFLHEPRREVETYSRILAPAGLGPRCIAAVADAEPKRYWLLIEKVPGIELWQTGDLAVWEDVAAWLGRLHARFAGRAEELRTANPHLLECSDGWFREWGERAGAALADSSDRRAAELATALERYGEVVGALAALPRTFVHGELYPANVLVVQDSDPVGVYPVDWEMAAIGPGLLDLAALVGGWPSQHRQRLSSAYLRGLREADTAVTPSSTLAVDLARARLHLALQWLGWSSDWRPPPELAHDWLGEALTLARELGLI